MRTLFAQLLVTFAVAIAPQPARGQDATPSQEACTDAQILAITGSWVANPGERPLAKWTCVGAGDEIALAASATGGNITVIYRQGSKSPHHIACRTRTDCRNAYRIEKTMAATERSTWDDVADFFFSFFKPRKTTPVPGILRGSIAPPEMTPPQPVLCAQNGEVAFTAAMGIKMATWSGLAADAPVLNWGADRGVAIAKSEITRPYLYLFQSERASSGVLHGLYGLKGGSSPSVAALLLVAPASACEPLWASYSLAMNYTESWPADIPNAAKASFLVAYLEAMAEQPTFAPVRQK